MLCHVCRSAPVLGRSYVFYVHRLFERGCFRLFSTVAVLEKSVLRCGKRKIPKSRNLAFSETRVERSALGLLQPPAQRESMGNLLMACYRKNLVTLCVYSCSENLHLFGKVPFVARGTIFFSPFSSGGARQVEETI